MSADTRWLICGVLRAEIEALHRQGRIGGRLVFLDSMLHMTPPRLESALGSALGQAAPEGRLVLVYGDCCAGMADLVLNFRASRVDAINCAQLLLGRARYRELMRERAFVLLPEWAGRWREVLQSELGLSEQVARELMADHRGPLVYLDTGLAPVPLGTVEECAAYTGMPWRVETVTLDPLLASLVQAEAAAPPRAAQEQSR